MIESRTGSIFEDYGVDAFVNPVNCVGVMGAGLARQFRDRFPGNYASYRTACDNREVRRGRVFIYRALKPRFILNFATKRHWRACSRISDIETGLIDLVRIVEDNGIASLAIPPLGCGLGGLKWEEVRPLIVDAFDDLEDVTAVLYEPY